AGIRESDETVEAAGIKRSIKEIEKSALIIAVFDSSSPLAEEDNELVSLLKGKEDRVIAVMNKCDKGNSTSAPFENAVYMSAATGEGFEELQNKILSFAGASEADTQDIVVSARQYSAIERALENIEDAITALDGFTQDIAGECIERAVSALGEIDGRTAALEIVNEIFSHFCVGK
ncbi:MAG: tRNA uridine-5-carboxymethylaminomethyl(34) synthesis GTPase MnmE, partial [Clostridia bacterium]|nr:tRNA uridine-5-carboxymethylaminomethyl(34) synthesis GTPase MnmE [Clostridia bacterium]